MLKAKTTQHELRCAVVCYVLIFLMLLILYVENTGSSAVNMVFSIWHFIYVPRMWICSCLYAFLCRCCCCSSLDICLPSCFLNGRTYYAVYIVLVLTVTSVLSCWSTPLGRTVDFVLPRLTYYCYTSLHRWRHVRTHMRRKSAAKKPPFFTIVRTRNGVRSKITAVPTYLWMLLVSPGITFVYTTRRGDECACCIYQLSL